MGCKESKMGCCEARRKKLKVKHEGGPASCELTALKIENANAAHVHEDVEKEKAEWLEKQRKEVTRLLQQHQEEKEYLKEAHQAETKTLSQEIKIQVEKEKDLECKQQLSEQYDSLKREQEARLRELQKAHEQEKLFLTESHQRSQSSLQETIDGLSSQMKSFQEKMKRVEESILSRDYKKHIQDYGSPSQFWEQELESLHFVIEMKNERIHNLDKKLLNLETVTERNLLLEEKMKTLQQENEDLQVRMQNHMAVTRQLSDELLTIREALQKESQLREQAHREKEELLYRVLNGDSSHAFPLSTEAPLIAT
ncbi:coiled-coil domain-containing protein 69 isoform X2 [Hemicordylus capensis]|uniref:coiled-coil domain-containing protein 69 isoform X2 n=1 Tax=Hemicordylus capensis TaxID=884348 RepID=UPI002302B1C5|nr:coiled-coil domain-containing protein 69 isoform X2 [Hemicordylus capensis]